MGYLNPYGLLEQRLRQEEDRRRKLEREAEEAEALAEVRRQAVQAADARINELVRAMQALEAATVAAADAEEQGK